jgi:membrane fusion protein (multidrug efflux system)
MRNCGMPNMSKSEPERPEPQAQPLSPALSPSDGAGEGSAAEGKTSFWRRRPVIVVGTVVLFALLFWGLRYLAEGLTHEATDDAFLDANVISIAPKVPGQVKQVHVKSNQAVKAGDLLVEIDPRDLAVQLEQKRAGLNAARANLDLLKASFELRRTQIGTAEATTKQSAAEVAAAEANAEKARADLKRAAELIQNHTISPQEFDAAKMAATATEANVKAARERTSSDQSKVTEAKAQLETTRKALDWGEAQAHQAESDVQAAELNLSYARVTAPGDGYVTKKAVENGDYILVGQKLMALVPSDLYVTANFKESQLEHIRPGQPVKITVDSVVGRVFRGHVDSIMAGSGARFSLLPPENAVGNYVKVVQRIPVKILFDEPVEAGHVLGPGMSAVPLVKVKGHEISETVSIMAAAVGALVIGVLWWRVAGKRDA